MALNLRRRIRLLVEVDLDPIPGWGNTPEDFRQHVENLVANSIRHYHPVVTVAELSAGELSAALRTWGDATELAAQKSDDVVAELDRAAGEVAAHMRPPESSEEDDSVADEDTEAYGHA